MDMPHFGSKLPIPENGRADATDMSRPTPGPAPDASARSATDAGSAWQADDRIFGQWPAMYRPPS